MTITPAAKGLWYELGLEVLDTLSVLLLFLVSLVLKLRHPFLSLDTGWREMLSGAKTL